MNIAMHHNRRYDVLNLPMDHLYGMVDLVACAMCENALATSAARDLRCDRRSLKDGTSATLSHTCCSLCRDLCS